MSSRTRGTDTTVSDYVRSLSQARESEVLAELRAATEPMEWAIMQISIEQGRFMAMMTQMLGVTKALEVGTFTGYSALCVAEHLPEGGKLVACDVSEEWTSVGKPFWEKAGVADKIDLRIGPALETLDALIADGEVGTYDFAFIDADKTGYSGYYERSLKLLRPGGVIGLDNAFMGGKVADPETEHEGAKVMRELNERIFADERVDASIMPIGDGLLLARKR